MVERFYLREIVTRQKGVDVGYRLSGDEMQALLDADEDINGREHGDVNCSETEIYASFAQAPRYEEAFRALGLEITCPDDN
jgi:hypothetical protein